MPALARARRRGMWLGDYLSWITAVLWFGSGFAFAWWIHLEVQALTGEIPSNVYAHFVPSQFLWGLIAAVQVFFLTSALSVRAYVPALVELGKDASDDVNELAALQKRCSWYFGAAISTPFIALILLATDIRYSAQVGPIAGVGFVCLLVAWYLSRQIQRDIGALIVALEPGREVLGGGETSESFWTGSR